MEGSDISVAIVNASDAADVLLAHPKLWLGIMTGLVLGSAVRWLVNRFGGGKDKPATHDDVEALQESIEVAMKHADEKNALEHNGLREDVRELKDDVRQIQNELKNIRRT